MNLELLGLGLMIIPTVFLSRLVLRPSAIDFLSDPRGIFSFMLVVGIVLAGLAMLIIELIKSLIHFVSGNPLALVFAVAVGLPALFVGWKFFRYRRFSAIDF